MSPIPLEERVARLELLFTQSQVALSGSQPRRKDWRRTIGMFDGDPVMGEIIDGALRMREAERTQMVAEGHPSDT